MESIITLKPEVTRDFKSKTLFWAKKFKCCCLLDSNNYAHDPYSEFEFVFGAKPLHELTANEDGFEKLKAFHDEHKSWMFGFLSYDLKNEIEDLKSENFDSIGFPQLHFFIPSILIFLKKDQLTIRSSELTPAQVFREILDTDENQKPGDDLKGPAFLKPVIPRVQYLETIYDIKKHISEGDIYEMNFCQEWYSSECRIDPYHLFKKFNRQSKPPFAAFYLSGGRYLLCASPERFLKKSGNQLISQPIKGTIKRGETDEEDQQLKEELKNSAKDQAENIMIVDLVRNDLAKSCEPGSVEVKELYGIYGFDHVYQMISTVSGKKRKGVHFADAIKNAFPMGSMTGAPKVRSMQLIEHYELSKRGLYSGAVGYITPDGDFDFNVVIRSMLYNSHTQFFSFHAGGAIVYDSNPDKEYEETILKASGMMKALYSDD